MAGFMKVSMGDRLKRIDISRSDVANGTIGRAVLLDPNPRACYIAYDADIKRVVLCDQELAIKYKLNPRTTYLLLIARLETDMKGNVLGDNFVVEYLSLSDKVYETFLDNYSELENVRTIKLKKESTSPTFSYVKPIPSKDPLPEDTQARIDEAIATLNIESMWEMIQNNLAISPEKYEELKRQQLTPGDVKSFEKSSRGTASAISQGNQHRQVAQSTQRPSPQPVATEPESGFDDFQEADDFNEFDENEMS